MSLGVLKKYVNFVVHRSIVSRKQWKTIN